MTICDGCDCKLPCWTKDDIRAILRQHVPFKNEPFHPRAIIRRVFRTPRSWFGKKTLLHPVAFEARIAMFEFGGGVSSQGSMSAYLWLDADKRLIERVNGKYTPANIGSLTEKDVANLKIGIKGDTKLLDADYRIVHQAMLGEILT